MGKKYEPGTLKILEAKDAVRGGRLELWSRRSYAR
jgi:hypothetical protein